MKLAVAVPRTRRDDPAPKVAVSVNSTSSDSLMVFVGVLRSMRCVRRVFSVSGVDVCV